MKRLLAIITFIFSFMPFAKAQNNVESDVFVPIGKYIEAGDYEKLSAWFADNLEVDITGKINNCTRTQAKLAMKSFFEKHTPDTFKVIHKSGKSPMIYAVGSLSAGGSKYRVIIFVKAVKNKNEIQQIRIESE